MKHLLKDLMADSEEWDKLPQSDTQYLTEAI